MQIIILLGKEADDYLAALRELEIQTLRAEAIAARLTELVASLQANPTKP